MNDRPHKSYEEEVKNSFDYDSDGYNNYLDYQYDNYPFGKKDKEASHED